MQINQSSMLRQQKNFEHILDQLCGRKITKERALELLTELIDAEIANNYIPIPYWQKPNEDNVIPLNITCSDGSEIKYEQNPK